MLSDERLSEIERYFGGLEGLGNTGRIVRELIAAVRALRADRDRYHGLLHAEGIADMHYCERHERGYMAPDHMPEPKCPRCELEAVERERDRYKEALETIRDGNSAKT